jgi:Acetyltransferase (GNAT) domain
MAGLRLDVVSDAAALVDMRGDWGDAAAADPDATAFLTWQWATAWWQHHGGDDRELHVVVVRDGQGIVALLPLVRSSEGRGPERLRLTGLRSLGAAAPAWGGCLLARYEPQAVELVVNHLGAQLRSGVGVVVLARLAGDARFTHLLGEELVRHAATVETVIEQLDDGSVVAEGGGVSPARPAPPDGATVVVHTGPTLEAGLDRLAALAPVEPFVADVVAALDAEEQVIVASLEVGGVPVAATVDLATGERTFPYLAGVDPGFTTYDPVGVLRPWSIRHRRLSTVTLSRPGLAGAVRRNQASRSNRSRSSWVSRLTTRRASPPRTNTTGGLGTLL